jgi:Holliday junction resolvase RusA-like endonuclease
MKIEFFIPGRLPGLNELIGVARGTRGRGSVMAAAAQKATYTNRVALYVIEQRPRGSKPFPAPVHIDLTWFEKDRRRDPDNIVSAKKFVLDGLVKANVIENDGWEHIAGFSERWVVDKNRIGVCVKIREEA